MENARIFVPLTLSSIVRFQDLCAKKIKHKEHKTDSGAGTWITAPAPYFSFEKFFKKNIYCLPEMEEIIVILNSDSDGSIFRSLIGTLQEKKVQILDATDLAPSVLDLGDIRIFSE